jgi:hypothetical protein
MGGRSFGAVRISLMRPGLPFYISFLGCGGARPHGLACPPAPLGPTLDDHRLETIDHLAPQIPLHGDVFKSMFNNLSSVHCL